MFTSILTTGELYEEDVYKGSLIIANKGNLKPYQTVIAVGSGVRDIEAGDKVMINLLHFAVFSHDPNSVKEDMDIMKKVKKWNIPWIEMDDENGEANKYLLIDNKDVEFVFEGEEKNDSIIIPDKPIIITN
jgi:hypothetical protein